ncbi:hypothetical protein Tco_0678188 [Tanacetum coccineum]|uniref:Uncharacterized protein n=1 Tax=Tanacetum coccineum TaxID=301880 RepID=A0ABQ4XEC7_9ASTR
MRKNRWRARGLLEHILEERVLKELKAIKHRESTDLGVYNGSRGKEGVCRWRDVGAGVVGWGAVRVGGYGDDWQGGEEGRDYKWKKKSGWRGLASLGEVFVRARENANCWLFSGWSLGMGALQL